MIDLTPEQELKRQKNLYEARKNKGFFKPCSICQHPDRPKVEERLVKRNRKLTKKEINFRGIAQYLQKHRDPGWKRMKTDTIAAAIRTHWRHLEEAPQYILIETNKEIEGGMKKATIENFAQDLLDIAQDGIEHYRDNPEKLPIKYALDAQKLLIAKQNSKTKEKALEIAMANMFGGFVEGEVVEEEYEELESGLDGE